MKCVTQTNILVCLNISIGCPEATWKMSVKICPRAKTRKLYNNMVFIAYDLYCITLRTVRFEI